MLHLPALVITRQIEKVFRSLQKISLVVRGLYGEGSDSMGDFYQISNQITLGKGEEDLIGQVSEVVPILIDYERKARKFLVNESQKDLYDKVSQAFAVYLPVSSVGVTGDQRRYEHVIALRAVETIDFMTARWAELPYSLLAEVSNRIVNDVAGVSRVVYDISGKPPATIEWE